MKVHTVYSVNKYGRARHLIQGLCLCESLLALKFESVYLMNFRTVSIIRTKHTIRIFSTRTQWQDALSELSRLSATTVLAIP